jgi:hypothetical protein
MSYIERLRANREKAASAQDESKRLANGWGTDPKTRDQVDASLKAQGLDADSIMAESFVDAIDALQAIERMLTSAELRRNMALREIERRRSILGRALRQASDQVIDGASPLVPAIH